MGLINWTLIRNPANWIILTLMVVIATIALSFLFHEPAQEPAQ